MKIFGRDFESEPIARWSLAVVFGWLGVMRVLEGGRRARQRPSGGDVILVVNWLEEVKAKLRRRNR